MRKSPHTVMLLVRQLPSGAMPGRLAAIEQSTMPQTIATPKAYACSQPRMRGLPMSTGLSRDAVFVSMAQGYGTVGYLAVVTSATEDFPCGERPIRGSR